MPTLNVDSWFQPKLLCGQLFAMLQNSATIDVDFEALLKQLRPFHLNLLKFPTRSAADLDQLRKSTTDGLKLTGSQKSLVLTQKFVDEALILSQLFDINEICAVELLLAGERYSPNFPNLARGLCAILVFYEYEQFVMQSLHAIIEAKSGKLWSSNVSSDLTESISGYLTQLRTDGLLSRLCELVSGFSLQRELDKLQAQRGIGPPKHRKMVSDTICTVYELAAQCLSCWCAQQTVSPAEFSQICLHLRNISLPGTSTSGGTGTASSAPLERCTCLLMGAALWCIDTSSFRHVDMERDELDGLLFTKESIVKLNREICELPWKSSQLQAIVTMAWSVALRALYQETIGQQVLESFQDDEEELLDRSLQGAALHCLRHCMLDSRDFFKEHLLVLRVHNLLTDMMILYPMKMKELRISAEDECRMLAECEQRGDPAPTDIYLHFRHLILLIGDFYCRNTLNPAFADEFWCTGSDGRTGGSFLQQAHSGVSQRQAALFKFVRSSAEVHAPTLYFAYLHMLNGLVANSHLAAQQCFLLLKSNASSSTAGHVSWDHFFAALHQYELALRADAHKAVGTAASAQIAPNEINGVIAWLKLSGTIAAQDEACALALCENVTWSCLNNIFGLLTCSVPVFLKAELFACLASFATCAQITTLLWQGLAAAGVVGSSGGGDAALRKGIWVELENVETQREDYSITLNFVRLVTALCKASPQGMLPSESDMQPYLEFVFNGVFLKFQSRPYKDANQMWSLAACCVEVMLTLIERLLVKHTDLWTINAASLTVMQQILTDGAIFRNVMWLLQEGVKMLDQYTEFTGKQSLELACLTALRLLHAVTDRQHLYQLLTRQARAPVLVTGLDVLLQSVSVHSGQTDYVASIAKYLTYNSWLPRHALYALRVLQALTRSISAQPKLLRNFVANEVRAAELRLGFVECFDCHAVLGCCIADDVASKVPEELSSTDLRYLLALEVVNFIYSCLVHSSAPSAAHFLLGFDWRNVAASAIENPAVNQSPQTCLHVLISLLSYLTSTKASVTDHQTPDTSLNHPLLLEKGFRVLYELVARTDSREPLCRYLRNSHDFVYEQVVQWCDFSTQLQLSSADGKDNECVRMLFCQVLTWLLKMAAIELQSLAGLKQRAQLSRLTKLFLAPELAPVNIGLSDPIGSVTADQLSMSRMFDVTRAATSRSRMDTTDASNKSRLATSRGGIIANSRRLFALLDTLDLDALPLPNPMLEYFDHSKLSQVIAACTAASGQGFDQCDVAMLHNLLHQEVSALHGTALSGQQPLISKEIEGILEYARRLNDVHRSRHWRVACLEAWCLCAETLFLPMGARAVGFLEIVWDTDQQIQLASECLTLILKRGLTTDLCAPQCYFLMASAVLVISQFLRNACSLADTASTAVGATAAGDDDSSVGMVASSQYVSILDGTRVYGRDRDATRQLGALGNLNTVLQLVIEWLLKPALRQSKTKTYLYGALINLANLYEKSLLPSLGLGGLPFATKTSFITDDEQRAVAGNSDTSSAREYLARSQKGVLARWLPELLPVLVMDACDGADVCKTLALCCLSALVRSDAATASQVSGMLARDGSLRHVLDSLATDDLKLQAVLVKAEEPLRPLYIFMAKLSMLVSLASCETGALALLENEALVKLATCRCLAFMPSDVFTRDETDADMASSLGLRFAKLFGSVLQFSLAIISGVGVHNRQAAYQVLQFLASNLDTVTHVLRSGQRIESRTQLKLLALVTTVVSHAAVQADLAELAGALDLQAYYEHCARNIMFLYPCVTDVGAIVQRIAQTQDKTARSRLPSPQALESELHACTVLNATVNYLNRVMMGGAAAAAEMSQRIVLPVFAPVFETEAVTASGAATGTIPIGWLCACVRHVTVHVNLLRERAAFVQRQRDRLGGNLSLDESKLMLTSEHSLDMLSTMDRDSLVLQRLATVNQNIEKQELLLRVTMERCLLMLWRHLDYYLVQVSAAAGDSASFAQQGPSVYQLLMRRADRAPMSRLQESGIVSSQDRAERSKLATVGPVQTAERWPSKTQLDKFRADLPRHLGEPLLTKVEKLYAAEETTGSMENIRGGGFFVEAVVRQVRHYVRLKSGVQL